MGATVTAYWPGITNNQIESQPGFYNDCKSWGNWMALREEEPDVYEAIKELNAEALLTFKTDGMDDDDVVWVSPQQLRNAATKVREAVRAGMPETKIILEVYRRSGKHFDSVARDFVRDLDDIIIITEWAESEGASKMTLEVNW